MHRQHLATTGALLTLVTGAAFAQGNPSENDRGFYAGAGIGQFNVEIDGLDGIDEAINDLDADDMSWKIFGGYRLNPFISLEAAYVNFGEPGDDFSSGGASGDYNLQISGFAPFVVGTLPVGPVELSARVGYYFYDLEVDADLDDLGGDVFSSDDSGEDVAYGVGVGMTFLQRLNAKLEYETVDIEGTDDANAFWLSASWRF
jgi:hypothetical protein